MSIDLTKKYLVQDIKDNETTFTVYETYLLATTSPREYIGNGQGKEVTYKNQLSVSAFNKNDFGGGVRTDRADLESYIMSDSINLPSATADDTAGIVKVVLDECEWLYPEYFLSGKMDEQYAVINKALAPTMRKYEFALTIAKQQEIASALTSGDAFEFDGSAIPTSAYVEGTATSQLPALAQFQLFVNYMTNDNTFANLGQYVTPAKPLPAGMYVNTKIDDLVFICHPSLKYKLQTNLHNWSVRDKEKFENLVESFKDFPVQYKNPQTGILTPISLVSENQILVIEKKYFDRIYNYSNESTFLWQQNQTVRYMNLLRESVGAYKFTSVGLFECDGLLQVINPSNN